MADFNPTVPTDSTQDKRLRVSSLQRVDAVDYTDISAVLSSRVANWLRSIVIHDQDVVIRGFRTVEQGPTAMAVDIIRESGEGYSAAMIGGHVLKEVSATVALTIDLEPGVPDRFDLITIRYGEDEGDLAQRAQITSPQVFQVIDEAPGTGTGDGVTDRYDFANPGVINFTIVGRVNGVPVNVRLAKGAGTAGADQMVFADPPAAGAPIRVDYYYMTGGVEQLVGINTRFTSVVDYAVVKGTPGGGVPATPSERIKISEVGPINSGTTTITDSLITQTRVHLGGTDASSDPIAGSLLDWIASTPVYRDGSRVMDLRAATTQEVRRSVNGTDVQPLWKYLRRGETTRPPTFISAEGHLRRYANYFRDDFMFYAPASSGSATWRQEDIVNSGTFPILGVPDGIGGFGGVQAGAVVGDRSRVRSPNPFLTSNFSGTAYDPNNVDRMFCAWTAFPGGTLDILEYALDARDAGTPENQFIRFYVDRSNSGTGLGSNWRAQVHTGTIVSGVNIGFNDVDPDTITRASGSFITDGFADTGWVLVKGSATQDGIYKIDTGGVAALTLTLDSAETLSTVAPAAGITLHFLAVNIDTGIIHDGAIQHVWEITQNQAGTIQFIIDGTLVGSTAVIPDAEDYFIVWGVEKVVANSVNYVNTIECGSGPLLHIA